MDIVLDIALVILVLAAAALCIYVIITLKEVNKTIAELRGEITDIKTKVDPILTNVDIISNKAALLTVEVENQVNNLLNIVNELKEKVENFFGSKSKTGNSSHNNNGSDWYTKVLGFYKGASAFWSTFKHK